MNKSNRTAVSENCRIPLSQAPHHYPGSKTPKMGISTQKHAGNKGRIKLTLFANNNQLLKSTNKQERGIPVPGSNLKRGQAPWIGRSAIKPPSKMQSKFCNSPNGPGGEPRFVGIGGGQLSGKIGFTLSPRGSVNSPVTKLPPLNNNMPQIVASSVNYTTMPGHQGKSTKSTKSTEEAEEIQILKEKLYEIKKKYSEHQRKHGIMILPSLEKGEIAIDPPTYPLTSIMKESSNCNSHPCNSKCSEKKELLRKNENMEKMLTSIPSAISIGLNKQQKVDKNSQFKRPSHPQTRRLSKELGVQGEGPNNAHRTHSTHNAQHENTREAQTPPPVGMSHGLGHSQQLVIQGSKGKYVRKSNYKEIRLASKLRVINYHSRDKGIQWTTTQGPLDRELGVLASRTLPPHMLLPFHSPPNVSSKGGHPHREQSPTHSALTVLDSPRRNPSVVNMSGETPNFESILFGQYENQPLKGDEGANPTPKRIRDTSLRERIIRTTDNLKMPWRNSPISTDTKAQDEDIKDIIKDNRDNKDINKENRDKENKDKDKDNIPKENKSIGNKYGSYSPKVSENTNTQSPHISPYKLKASNVSMTSNSSQNADIQCILEVHDLKENVGEGDNLEDEEAVEDLFGESDDEFAHNLKEDVDDHTLLTGGVSRVEETMMEESGMSVLVPNRPRENSMNSMNTSQTHKVKSRKGSNIESRSHLNPRSPQPIINKKFSQKLINPSPSKKRIALVVDPNARKKPISKKCCSSLNPKNLEEQEEEFFESGCLHNPQFIYEQKGGAKLLKMFKSASGELLSLAMDIMESFLEEYGSYTDYLEGDGGEILSKEETERIFKKYIDNLDLSSHITLSFTSGAVCPTSITHDFKTGNSQINIGLPIEYRRNRIMGVLNHEIGTHFLRRFNDSFQPWASARKKYEMRPYIVTEEGLAALNQIYTNVHIYIYIYNIRLWIRNESHFYLKQHLITTLSVKLLRCPLLNYSKTWVDILMTKRIGTSITNKYSYRWRLCVRVKRGLKDTSLPGGLYKDKVYIYIYMLLIT